MYIIGHTSATSVYGTIDSLEDAAALVARLNHSDLELGWFYSPLTPVDMSQMEAIIKQQDKEYEDYWAVQGDEYEAAYHAQRMDDR